MPKNPHPFLSVTRLPPRLIPRSAASGPVHTWSPDPLTPTRMAHPPAELRYGLVIKPRGAIGVVGPPADERHMIVGGFEGGTTVDAVILTGTQDSPWFIYRHLISDIWKFWEPVEED